MNTIKKVCVADKQGVLRIDPSIGRANQHVEVLVVWQEVGNEIDGPGDDATTMADLVGMLEPGDLERR